MGRTSLLLIIAFNVTFMLMGFRMSNATSKAYEKYCSYADIEQAQCAVESCANIAISAALLDTPTVVVTTRCSNEVLFGKDGSTFTVKQYPTYDAMMVQKGESLTVTGTYKLKSISPTLEDPDPKLTYATVVEVTGNSFSQYVFYSVSENGVNWGKGDTCRGKLHTQDKLQCMGTAGPPKTGPDFKGFVTTKLGVQVNSGQPNFEQGKGVADISLPTELTDLNKYGATANGGRFICKLDTYVEFKIDGSVTVRTEPRGTATSSTTCWNQSGAGTNTTPYGPVPKCTTYASVSALTTSGVLLVQNADLHVKGKLDGKVTLGCVDTSKLVSGLPVYSGMSEVYIDGSLTYKDAPPCSKNPTNVTDDMLGIVSTNNVWVSEHIDHDASKATLGTGTPPGVEINGSIFSQQGSFGAENYTGRGICGTLKLVGGLQQKTRGAVGQGNPLTTGFLKDYDWDNNLQFGAPIGYPTTKFVIKKWIDKLYISSGFWQ
jgi:hypothetical protein